MLRLVCLLVITWMSCHHLGEDLVYAFSRKQVTEVQVVGFYSPPRGGIYVVPVVVRGEVRVPVKPSLPAGTLKLGQEITVACTQKEVCRRTGLEAVFHMSFLGLLFGLLWAFILRQIRKGELVVVWK